MTTQDRTINPRPGLTITASYTADKDDAFIDADLRLSQEFAEERTAKGVTESLTRIRCTRLGRFCSSKTVGPPTLRLPRVIPCAGLRPFTLGVWAAWRDTGYVLLWMAKGRP